jgi:hypothetical protein
MGAGEPDAATSDAEAEILEGGIRALQGNELSDEGALVAEHGEVGTTASPGVLPSLAALVTAGTAELVRFGRWRAMTGM